jgi:L-histidine N-alpha-methyltransferase
MSLALRAFPSELLQLGPQSTEQDLADDVLEGLTRPFKELPSRYLYDGRGSELFEAICQQPEYYPTRTEREILLASAGALAEATQADELLELGSGSSEKAVILLDALQDLGVHTYYGLDVAPAALEPSIQRIRERYSGLSATGLVGDFERDLGAIPAPTGTRLVAFLGGTFGNLTPGRRRRFLRGVRALLGKDGHLLLGVDLLKDPRVIEAAYNDQAGITAAFNLNMLEVLNDRLDADFDLAAFDHFAFFDYEHQWIEMRLRSRRRQTARVKRLGLDVHFDHREELRTEISSKFTLASIEALLSACGLRLVEAFSDPGQQYANVLAALA